MARSVLRTRPHNGAAEYAGGLQACYRCALY